MISLTNSNVIAMRMAKRFAAELVWMRENRIHPESDLCRENHRAINAVASELDIRCLDVIRSRSVGKNIFQREKTIRMTFGRTTVLAQDNVAIGRFVVELWESWEPVSGQVTVEFHDGHKMSSLETDYDDNASSLPPL